MSIDHDDAPTFQNNPASLSPLLGSLFPPGVVGAELRIAGDPSLLFPDEILCLVRAARKRTQEFAAGRLCARRALAEFGFGEYPLRMSSDRRPQWPNLVVGSITHTTEHCSAVVAQQKLFRAIGLDSEIVEHVTPEIRPTVCTPEEMAWLDALSQPEHGRRAALIFSAKESFYKCQYSVTRQWLEFDDVTLDLPSSDVSAGYIALRPKKRIALLEHDPAPWIVRFKYDGSLVVTGMALVAR